MKICYIADGLSLHTQRWLNYFAASQKHEVHLISSRFTPHFQGYDNNIQMHSLMRIFPKFWKISGYVSGIFWPCQVRNLIQKINPDIVDAHFITLNGYLGWLSGFHPLVLTAWGSDILILPKINPVHNFLTRRSLKKADAIISLSFSMTDEIISLGANEEKINKILIGVNSTQFTSSRRDMTLRKRFGVTDKEPIIISTRDLCPLYNIETLIQAIPLVRQAIPRAKFIIASDGPQRMDLENLAISLHVEDSIIFTGFMPYADVSVYLASSDIYTSTSLSDGTSNSLLEAMACNLPSIVTDIPANQDWIENGVNGFLFPAKDYKLLAEKIIYLSNQQELRAIFGEISRKIILERAEYQTEMAKIEGLYLKLQEKSLANSHRGKRVKK